MGESDSVDSKRPLVVNFIYMQCKNGENSSTAIDIRVEVFVVGGRGVTGRVPGDGLRRGGHILFIWVQVKGGVSL